MKIPKREDPDSALQLGDLVFNFVAFLVCIVLLLSMLPKQKEKVKKDDLLAGNVFAAIRWPEKSPQDIDLWVEGPDGQPVGYSNPVSSIFSYLRDDLGSDAYSDLNYELAVSQGIAEGRYVINVHFFSSHSGALDIPIEAEVIIKRPGKGNQEIFKGKVILAKVGDEITIIQFALDKDGKLVNGSISNQFSPVRNKPRLETTRPHQ